VLDDDVVHRLHLIEIKHVEQRCAVSVVIQIVVAERAGESSVIVDVN